MAQRKPFDRFAQMEKQQELIAKKRQEILEKQKTQELAKKVALSMKQQSNNEQASTPSTIVAEKISSKEQEKQMEKTAADKTPTTTTSAAATTTTTTTSAAASTTTTTSIARSSLIGKTGKLSFGLKRSHQPAIVPVHDEPKPKVTNSFCNDGSFLDHFKKILESQKPKIPTPVETPAPPPAVEAEPTETENTELADNGNGGTLPPPVPLQLQTAAQNVPPPPPPAVSVAMSLPPPTQSFAFQTNFLPQGMLLTQQQPPEQTPLPAAAFFSAHFANFTPPQLPPPPPPPQLPISLASLAPLYMIPAPEPIQISAIQAPKEFDLNAIPKPQLNLEAIQVPAATSIAVTTNQAVNSTQANTLTETATVTQQSNEHEDNNDNHNCIQLPTTIESLIALVAENGDEYEDKIRTLNVDQLHPAMWFLFDKNCQQYQLYRSRLSSELQNRLQQQQQQREQQQQEQQDQPNLSPTDDQQFNNGISAENADSNSMQQQQDEHETAEKYDPESAFGGDVDSDEEYMRDMQDRNREQLEQRIVARNNAEQELQQAIEDQFDQAAEEKKAERQRKKQRRSRWGEKVQGADESGASNSETTMPSSSAAVATSFANQNKPLLTTITRTDPGLLNYARLNYGSINLSEEDWKKCEDHYKVNLLYQDMMRKREEIDRLAKSGKFKYEYDSDEDVDGGTWEHKLRTAEMEATRAWASALTKQSEGKHHIGDFLPPEELKKFMEQYDAKKNNRQPDLSDYKEFKLKEDNIGFQMLQKLGWKEGQGLGQDGSGIVDPVNKAVQRDGNQGLGVAGVAPEDCDNEYDAYRKRMMLAYRFRPNPLNNPRRAYY